jgi:hypothetical protein
MSTMPGTHRRGAGALALVAVLGLVLGAAGCGDDASSSPPTRPARDHPREQPRPGLSNDFEDGAALDGASVSHATVAAGAAKNGRLGLEVRSDGSEAYAAWAAERFGGPLPYWSFRAWVRVTAWTPDESVDLFTVRNQQVVNNFDLFVGAPWRKLQWDLFRQNSVETPWQAQLGRWYLVEARGSFATSTYTADVRIDGVAQPSIASPGQPPSAVKEFVLGSIGTAKTNRAQFDDAAIRVAKSPLPFLGPPPAAGPPGAPSGAAP